MTRLAALVITLAAAPAFAAPRLVDTIGASETDVHVIVIPANPPKWVPEARFFVEHDGWSQEDVVLVDWKDGKKSLGKPFPCAARNFFKSVQKDPTTPVVPANVGVWVCRFPDDAAISKAGTFQLALTYKSPLSGKTDDLGALTFKAVETSQGSQNKPTTSFAGDRDHQLGYATVEEYEGGHNDIHEKLGDALNKHHRIHDGPHMIVIRFWTKHDDKGPNQMTMSCMLGDKKVAEGNNDTNQGPPSYWTHKGKDRLTVRYQQQGFIFRKMIAGKMKPGNEARFAIGDNPGDYRCVAMASGEIVKEVFFTVGADGEIQKTPCDDQVVRLNHVHIVRNKDRAVANLPYDEKAGKKTGYFGRVDWKAGCPSG